MDKDEALPIAVPTKPTGFGWDSQTAKFQRDADFIILERDYVPKERVKMLVGALRACDAYLSWLHNHHRAEVDHERERVLFVTREALANLGVEVKR